MFMVDWFRDVLTTYGLLDKHAKLLFVGLDNSGKTSLLHMLKNEKVGAIPPTLHPNMVELKVGNIIFATHDMGGHSQTRSLWDQYSYDVSGVIFLVDSAEPSRFEEAKYELDRLLTNQKLEGVPFLVLGNKVDSVKAVSEKELREGLGFEYTTGKGIVPIASPGRPMELFMCSILHRQGYGDGIRWLSQYVK
ncbi:hypothetical protein INT47_011545 [Mucor saturninus]|uniref:Small COPII coat GTPase SAR1 n=1 Tax=Mucor saturninus TaxID=64648 RepID=A0A8H7V122_9FUNG|nr:hypothetical protein INT47_011545 [Mucor saturninus]